VSITQSARQALVGMQKIERAIMDEMRARQVPITAAVFSWNRGQGTIALLPDPVPMDVRLGARHASASWPRVCLQDPGHCLHRIDVRAEIERIVEALAPPREMTGRPDR
jgi:hypothetical protein